MKRSDTNSTWKDDALGEEVILKVINNKKAKDNAKEIDVYYCLLLIPS